MKLYEFIRLVYGTLMGTSTQYVKSSKRHLFPIKHFEIEDGVLAFVGGSCNSVYFTKQNVLVNPGEGKAATYVRDFLEKKYALEGIRIICTQPSRNFSSGSSLYTQVDRLVCGGSLEHDLRGEVLNSDENWNGIELKLSSGPFGQKDIVVQCLDGRVVLLGALFYNQIHPPIHSSTHIDRWIEVLKALKLDGAQVVPGEGELARGSDISVLVEYLSSLKNPQIEFSELRQRFDWTEIIGSTSLEENFDLVRNRTETHGVL